VLLVLLVAAGRSLSPTDGVKPDPGTLTMFVAVTLTLAAVMHFTPSHVEETREQTRQTAATQSFLACNLRCEMFSR
jgi:hypothetical protein